VRVEVEVGRGSKKKYRASAKDFLKKNKKKIGRGQRTGQKVGVVRG